MLITWYPTNCPWIKQMYIGYHWTSDHLSKILSERESSTQHSARYSGPHEIVLYNKVLDKTKPLSRLVDRTGRSDQFYVCTWWIHAQQITIH